MVATLLAALAICFLSYQLGLTDGRLEQQGIASVALQKRADASEKALEEQRRQFAAEAFRSAEESNRIASDIEERQRTQAAQHKKAIDRLQAQLQKEKENAKNECIPAADFRFDVGTIRLLNEARQEHPVQLPPDPSLESAARVDEESGAPSTVGIGEFVESDTVIVRMYQALKKRHDGLVDWVNEKLQEQNQ